MASARVPSQAEGGYYPPLVSIVIPCYAQAHFVSESIESALAQTHPKTEIIVVDDGSRDNAAEVVARYPGVLCLRQENRGLAEARNAGLALAAANMWFFSTPMIA